jgi:putative Ca2+/H+ antiporter (TMEM165/GDT1 family)
MAHYSDGVKLVELGDKCQLVISGWGTTIGIVQSITAGQNVAVINVTGKGLATIDTSQATLLDRVGAG